MPRKKTHEEYIKEVAEINPNIEVLDMYINTRTKILHQCKIDGHKWYVKPNHILLGIGCPVCSGVIKKTHNEYIVEVAKINQNIIVVEDYKGNKVKILHKCKTCEHEWMATPSNILNGSNCPVCSKRKKKTQEEYIVEVNKINPNIEVIGTYITNKIEILHRCKIDGYEWYSSPHSILLGCGCPQCSRLSNGERLIGNWLDSLDIVYKRQKTFDDCRDKHLLRFDFYLPNYNILIEYNGIQHYKPIDYFGGQKRFESQVLKDKIKEEYCKKNNIPLFKIPYYSDLNEELIKLYDLIRTKDMKKGVVV